MKKIVELYENHKILFLVITMFWIEIFTNICVAFEKYSFDIGMSYLRDPIIKIRETNLGNAVSYISIGVFVLLVVIPVITMLIALTNHLTFKLYVVPFIIIVVVAFLIGLYFACKDEVGITKLIYSFCDYLDDNYGLVEEVEFIPGAFLQFRLS